MAYYISYSRLSRPLSMDITAFIPKDIWGIYILVFKKPGHESYVYIGSATGVYRGVENVSQMDRLCMDDLTVSCIDSIRMESSLTPSSQSAVNNSLLASLCCLLFLYTLQRSLRQSGRCVPQQKNISIQHNDRSNVSQFKKSVDLKQKHSIEAFLTMVEYIYTYDYEQHTRRLIDFKPSKLVAFLFELCHMPEEYKIFSLKEQVLEVFPQPTILSHIAGGLRGRMTTPPRGRTGTSSRDIWKI